MKTLSLLAVSMSLMGLMAANPSITLAATEAKVSNVAQEHPKQAVSILFVLRAGQGVVTKTEKGFELTLKNPDESMLYFSDRPVRKAGLLSLSKFMNMWMTKGSSFKMDNPNAALVYKDISTTKNGLTQGIAVELSKPVKLENNAWTFQVKDLYGKMKAGSYNGVCVFIDDIPTGILDYYS